MGSDTSNSSARSLLTPRNIAAAVLVALAVIFIVQNRAATTIQLFWVSVQSPLWLTLVVILALGWIAGLLTTRHTKSND
ncbi:LapA family protein [Rhodococcus erythropolis]|uniref:LapA family protein n=1 Tax=Rhodococcus erythropolis TaxID=1833 RepID=UPI0033AFD990